MSNEKDLFFNPSTKIAMLAGAAAGFTVDVALYPLDTLKTRLQAPEGFLKAGGFKGVYKGMQSVALGSAPGSATFFVAYETSAPHLTKLLGGSGERKISGTDFIIPSNSPLSQMAAASVGEFSACLIRVPIDHIKMRLQTGHASSIIGAVKDVMEHGSKGGLYAGFGTTLTREIPFSIIQFPLYELLKRKLFDYRFTTLYSQQTQQKTLLTNKQYQPAFGNPINNNEIYLQCLKDAQVSPLYSSLIGSFCGFVAAALTTPLDVARTRIMLGVDPYGQRYKSDPISTIHRIFIEGCRHAKSLEQSLQENSKSTIKLDSQVIQEQVMSNPKTHLDLDVKAGDLTKFQRGGWNAIFRGVVPRTMWISIGGCVYFGAYETAKQLLLTSGSTHTIKPSDTSQRD